MCVCVCVYFSPVITKGLFLGGGAEGEGSRRWVLRSLRIRGFRSRVSYRVFNESLPGSAAFISCRSVRAIWKTNRKTLDTSKLRQAKHDGDRWVWIFVVWRAAKKLVLGGAFAGNPNSGRLFQLTEVCFALRSNFVQFGSSNSGFFGIYGSEHFEPGPNQTRNKHAVQFHTFRLRRLEGKLVFFFDNFHSFRRRILFLHMKAERKIRN